MKTLNIIVPVYNEKDTIEEITKKIEDTDYCGLEKNNFLWMTILQTVRKIF